MNSGPWSQYQNAAPLTPPKGPWDQFEKTEPTDHSIDPQAALEGFGQAGTAGYLPQLQAAAGSLVPNPSKDIDDKLESQGFKINQPQDDYLSRRDDNIARQQGFAENSPGSYYGGQVVGTIASAPMYGAAMKALTPFKAAEGAGLLKKAADAAQGGAAMGLLQNPGDTKGEVDPVQMGPRLNNAKSGAVIGAATQVAASAIKKGADLILKAPEALKDYAALNAAKSAGPQKAQWKSLIANKDPEVAVKQVGSAMIDNGLVKPGSTYEDVLNKSDQLKQSAANVIGSTYKAAKETVENPEFLASLKPEQRQILAKSDLNAHAFADEIEKKFEESLKGKAGSTTALNTVKTTLNELRQNGTSADILQMQDFKISLDDMINYNRDLADQPLQKQAIKQIRDFVKEKIQGRVNALDQVLGTNSLQSLKEANQAYGIWSWVSNTARNRITTNTVNRIASPSDYGAGGIGAAVGAVTHGLPGAIAGAGLGILNNVGRKYGLPVVTSAADFAGKSLSTIPKSVPGAISKTAGLLANNPSAVASAGSRLLNPPENNEAASPPPVILGAERTGRTPAKRSK